MKKVKCKPALLLAGVVVAAAAVLAIVLLTGGKKPEAVVSEIMPEDSILEIYRKADKLYKKNLQTIYGFTDKDANSVLSDEKEWKAYSIGISLDNVTGEDITVYSLEIEDNGADGIWISKYTDGEVGIPKGMKDSILYVSVLVNKNLPDKKVEAMIKDREIQLVYSKTPTIDVNGVESAEKKKTVDVG